MDESANHAGLRIADTSADDGPDHGPDRDVLHGMPLAARPAPAGSSSSPLESSSGSTKQRHRRRRRRAGTQKLTADEMREEIDRVERANGRGRPRIASGTFPSDDAP